MSFLDISAKFAANFKRILTLVPSMAALPILAILITGSALAQSATIESKGTVGNTQTLGFCFSTASSQLYANGWYSGVSLTPNSGRNEGIVHYPNGTFFSQSVVISGQVAIAPEIIAFCLDVTKDSIINFVADGASDTPATDTEIGYSFTLTQATTANGITYQPGTYGHYIVNGYSFMPSAPAPTITAISPAGGQSSGADSVTITGTNFTGATGASIGGLSLSNIVIGVTSITGNAPTGLLVGAKDVVVTTPGGTATLAGGYLIALRPAVTGLNPATGLEAGGTSVVITGTNFSGVSGAAAVQFGNDNAASYVVDSATQITAVAPAGFGVVAVRVTGFGGRANTTQNFTYEKANTAPVADAGDDQEVASGANVTLNGSGTDADNDTLTYGWELIDDLDFPISGASTQNPTFTAPTVTVDTDLVFQLFVNDDEDYSDPDTVTITVKAPADTTGPTVQITLSDTVLKIGDTSNVRITFSEPVTGFGPEDLNIASGTLSNFTAVDGGITWTATLNPNQGVTGPSGAITVNLTKLTDITGNPGVGFYSSPSYSIDTSPPRATVTVNETELRTGETSLVGITFNEAVTGFNNIDLTVPNGTFSAVSSSDSGISWTATYTPAANITDADNIIAVDLTGVVDLGGNAGSGTADSGNFAIDTERPAINSIIMDDTNLAEGQFTSVEFIFTEVVIGFTNDDLTIPNGNISNLSRANGGTGWSATYTPNAGVTAEDNVIVLDVTKIADAAGNEGTGTANSPKFSIDSQRPTITLGALTETPEGTYQSSITLSEAAGFNVFELADLTVGNGTATLAGAGTSFTATITPTSHGQVTLDVAANTFTDEAGNFNIAATRVSVIVAPANTAPVADAGPNQPNVLSGTRVTLDGSASYDVDLGTTLTYQWMQTSGTTDVRLSDSTAQTPTFAAPPVTQDTNLVFSLVVNDGTVASAAATVTITVKAADRLPVADITAALVLDPGERATLIGRSSYDPDDFRARFTYYWSAIEGTDSLITNVLDNGLGDYLFTAPTLARGDPDVTLKFSLVVESGGLRSEPKIHTMTVRVPVGFEQTIKFTSTPPQVSFFGDTFTPKATATSLLPVSFTIAKASVGKCDLNAGIVRLTGAGECTIIASQPGDIRWNAARETTQTLFANKASPEITFTSAAPAGAKIGGSYRPAATSTFGAPVALSINPDSSGVCRLENGSVIFENVGYCFVVGDVAATDNTNPATGSQAFLVSPATQNQTISFSSTPPLKPVFGGNYTPIAEATSGLPVTFSIGAILSPARKAVSAAPLTVCQIDGGGVVSFTGVGECVVTASQNGDAEWNAAAAVSQNFMVGRAPQLIDFKGIAALTFAPDQTIALQAAGGASGNPVTFTSETTDVCTVAPNADEAVVAKAGECSIRAAQAGNANYADATSVVQNFLINRAEQVISFDKPADRIFVLNETFTLTAEGGDSGNAVEFTSGGGDACSIDDDQVMINSAGICEITASQDGDDSYEAAEPVTHSFTIGKASQLISFSKPADQTFIPNGTVALNATGGASNEPIVFTSGSLAVCSVAGSTTTMLKSGTCVVKANQAGNETYAAAPEASISFAIGKAANTVAFTTNPSGRAVVGGSYVPAASATSGLPAMIKVDAASASVCDMPGNTVRFNAAGTCTLIAAEVGDERYASAQSAVQSFTIYNPIGLSPSAGRLPDVQFAVKLALKFTATGGLGGYRFEITNGALPDGLTLNRDGTVMGIPSREGKFVFTVTASDGQERDAAASFMNSSNPGVISAEYAITVTSNPNSDAISATADGATESSAITSGEVIVATVFDAGANGFSDTPDFVTQNANGFTVTLGKQARVSRGVEAIDSVTIDQRKAIRQRSGGSVPGLFAYADGGASAADAVDPSRFQAWASVRFTKVTTSAALNSLEGQQINGLMGLTYRLNEQTVIGAFGGYETMSFADAGTAQFGGHGITAGVYGAWRPNMGLRFEGQISSTQLGYDVSSGGVTGSFDANRIIAAVGVTGTTKMGTFMLEPSLKATSVWENQNAYVDGVGTAHNARAFNFGKVAAGLKASTTVDMGNGKSISPYAGVSADWRFSGGDATKTLKALDDWSMSVNGGFNAKLNPNTTLNLDGTVSGLGLDDVLVWSLKARLGVGF